MFPPSMGLLPDTYHCGLRMRRERFPRHRLQRKPLVNDPGMHHGTCTTHVPWWMSGSLTRGVGENVPGIPGACTTRNFTYLVRGPWLRTPLCTADNAMGYKYISSITERKYVSGLLIFKRVKFRLHPRPNLLCKLWTKVWIKWRCCLTSTACLVHNALAVEEILNKD